MRFLKHREHSNHVKGFKVFNPDWTCMGFQYEVGKVYEEDVKPSVRGRGFHFCKQAKDCFNYYKFDSNNKVAEVIALGDIAEEGDKCYTNIIKIEREITWEEVLSIVNTGKECTGLCNSGDWNKASSTVGCFNTQSQKLRFFDKETDMTFEEWRNSEAYRLMNRIDFRPADWIWEDEMSEAEKAKHPEYKTTGGYLKIRDNTDCCKEWWNGLTEREKQVIKNIPNFDADKFFIITGIRVE